MKKKLMPVSMCYVYCWCFIIIGCEQQISVSPETSALSRRTLQISSLPTGATIFVNGYNMGQFTPDSIVWIASDSSQISLRLLLYRDSLFSILIPADSATEIFVDFTKNPKMRGMLRSETSPPKAAIYLNDSLVKEVTPDFVKNLLPGYYNVRFKLKNCWDFDTVVTIKSDQSVILSVSLEDTSTSVTYLPENSGIPEILFNNLYIDSHGIKWLAGVSTGLTRFDGTNWKNYSTINSNLPSDYVTCIYEDANNNLWVGTDMGLAVLNGNNFIVYNKTNAPLPSDTVTALRYWSGSGMWIGTAKGMIANIGGAWLEYPEFPVVNQYIRCFAFSPDNILFVGTNTGLWGLKNTLWKPVLGFSNTQISALAMLSSGACFVGEDGFPAGLYQSLMLKKRRPMPTFAADPSLIINSLAINQILVLPGGIVWVATDKGIRRFTHSNHIENSIPGLKLKSQFIRGIFRDQDNNYWIVTYGGGLTKYKGK